jgi:hypothetical protein
MDWSSGGAAYVVARRARSCLQGSVPTNCGAPTTKASSCWAIVSTVVRSPSPITPAVICSAAKLFLLPGKILLLPCLKGCFANAACPRAVGIKEVQDDIWLVSFMDYDLGYFDLETRVLEPLENPFGPKLSPMP